MFYLFIYTIVYNHGHLQQDRFDILTDCFFTSAQCLSPNLVEVSTDIAVCCKPRERNGSFWGGAGQLQLNMYFNLAPT